MLESTYHITKCFAKNLLAIETKKKTQILMNRLVIKEEMSINIGNE